MYDRSSERWGLGLQEELLESRGRARKESRWVLYFFSYLQLFLCKKQLFEKYDLWGHQFSGNGFHNRQADVSCTQVADLDWGSCSALDWPRSVLISRREPTTFNPDRFARVVIFFSCFWVAELVLITSGYWIGHIFCRSTARWLKFWGIRIYLNPLAENRVGYFQLLPTSICLYSQG